MRRALTLAAVITGLFLAGPLEGADTAQIDAKIAKAISFLGKSDDSGPNAEMTFKLIVEAASLGAPATKYPAEYGENIDKAKKIFDTKSIVDPEGVSHLRQAYRLMNSGKDFEMPKNISTIEDAVDHAKVQLAAARKDLEAGKANECAQKLVEIAVMVVTPMEATLEK